MRGHCPKSMLTPTLGPCMVVSYLNSASPPDSKSWCVAKAKAEEFDRELDKCEALRTDN
jgi:hypothetical protein